MSIEGKVVFMRSKDHEKPYCICCGDPNTPHEHIFNRHIELPMQKSKVFAGGLPVRHLVDFEQEVLHLIPDIEGKNVRITIEVIE